MASTEIEEAPILSYTHPHLSDEHIEPQRPTLRNRSLSMSIPLRSMNEYVGANHLVSHTGPLLRRERGTPLIQTHGPLYISGRSGEFDRSFPLAGGQMSTIVDVEGSGSLDATDQNHEQAPSLSTSESKIMILFVSQSSPNSGFKLLSGLVFLQYPTRYYRCKSLLNGDSESGMPVKNASIIFCRNLFICIGSWWYLLGIQRVNDCLRNIRYASVLKNCQRLTYCGRGGDIGKLDPSWLEWWNISAFCFESDKFSYGMFKHVVMLASQPTIVQRSAYSFFWGLQQISTLAGNIVPSSYLPEILFGVSIVVLGLFLFALVVGDVLSVSQAIGWRRYEMQRRGTDVEQWMHNKWLPKQLRRKIRQSERFYWSATHGVNEKALLENLSEDLQREIYHHCFSFIKDVRIFAQMEGQILDAICGRLRQKLFIKGSKILDVGGVVDKMFFIVRGRIMSDDVDGNHISLSDGNLCGEEILSWCLGHSSVNKDGKKIRFVGQQFLSRRTVTCLTNVNTYSLRASDLDEVAAIFPIFLRRIQNTIRRESPYWRGFAARSIQVAWRYRKWRLCRAEISTHESRSA